MKSVKLFFLFFVAAIFFLFNSCEDVTDPADECDKTKWQEVKEPIIYLVTNFGKQQEFLSGLQAFSADTSIEIEIVGFIQKYYCNGTPSDKFGINTFFYPFPIAGDYYKIKVGQAYQFKFQNDEDHLRVNLKWKVRFNNGLTYESKTRVEDFRYINIIYEDYWSSYVIYTNAADVYDWVKMP